MWRRCGGMQDHTSTRSANRAARSARHADGAREEEGVADRTASFARGGRRALGDTVVSPYDRKPGLITTAPHGGSGDHGIERT